MSIIQLIFVLTVLCSSSASTNELRNLRRRSPGNDRNRQVSYRCASSAFEAERMKGDQCSDKTRYCFDPVSGPTNCGKLRCFKSPSCPYTEVSSEGRVGDTDEQSPIYKCSSDSEVSEELCGELEDCYDEKSKLPDDSKCISRSGTKCVKAENCASASTTTSGETSDYKQIQELEARGFQVQVVDWNPFKCVNVFDRITEKDCIQRKSCFQQNDKTKMNPDVCATHLPCRRVDTCNFPDGQVITVPLHPMDVYDEKPLQTEQYTYFPFKCLGGPNAVDTEEKCKELKPCHDDNDPSRMDRSKCGPGLECIESEVCPYKTVFGTKNS